MREPDYLGNRELLNRPISGFFSSRTTAPLSVLPTLDWAHEIARCSDAVVMSGFQSPMEREVFDILLSGCCGIIIVLNRAIYHRIPPKLSQAYDAERLLIISLIHGKIRLPSTYNANLRNKYIAETASTLIFSSVTPASSLYNLITSNSSKNILSF